MKETSKSYHPTKSKNKGVNAKFGAKNKCISNNS